MAPVSACVGFAIERLGFGLKWIWICGGFEIGFGVDLIWCVFGGIWWDLVCIWCVFIWCVFGASDEGDVCVRWEASDI
jgi:hypothetical protein